MLVPETQHAQLANSRSWISNSSHVHMQQAQIQATRFIRKRLDAELQPGNRHSLDHKLSKDPIIAIRSGSLSNVHDNLLLIESQLLDGSPILVLVDSGVPKKSTEVTMIATRLTTLQTPCETGLTRERVLKANCRHVFSAALIRGDISSM